MAMGRHLKGSSPDQLLSRPLVTRGLTWHSLTSALRSRFADSLAKHRLTVVPKKQAEADGEETHLRDLAHIFPVGVFKIDADCSCVYTNKRWCDISGLGEEEALGFGWLDGIHPQDHARVVQELRAAIAQRSSFRTEFRFKGEKVTWVSTEAVPEISGDGLLVGYVGATVDISGQKDHEYEVEMLQQITMEVSNAPDVRTALECIITRICEFTGWDFGQAWLPTAKGDQLECCLAYYSKEPGPAYFRERSCEYRFSPGVGLPGRAWQTKRPLWIADVIEDGSFKEGNFPRAEIVRNFGIRTGVAFPILSGDEVVSVVEFFLKHPEAENRRLLNLIGTITVQVGAIVQKKHAEDALKQGEERLKLALRAGNTLAWEWNRSTDTIICSENDFKFPPQAQGFPNKEFFDQLHPDDREMVLRNTRMAVEEGKKFQHEYRIPQEDGSVRWLATQAEPICDNAGKVVRVLGIVRDVTSRKNADEALRESERRFRQLSESMPQIVWSATAEGRIDYSNSKFFEQTGLKLEQLDPDRLWYQILHPDDATLADGQWKDCVASGKPFDMEYRYIDRRSGGYRWHLGRALPVRDEAGHVMRWYGTCTDIEEHKRSENALHQARKQMADHAVNLEKAVADRTTQLESSMKQMESFCYSIAHDLLAPLRAMQGFTTALKEDYSEAFDDLGKEYADRIVASSRRMERLIQDLLTYGRLNHIHISRGWVDMEACVDGVLAALKEEVKLRGAIVVVRRPLRRVWANSMMVSEIVSQLISNALKFVPTGLPPRVEVFCEVRDAQLRFHVKDNGIGIEPEHHERIFRVFEKLHGTASEQGTGIGLALVRKSVERLNGDVGVESEPGKGSCFWFELPANSDGVAANEI